MVLTYSSTLTSHHRYEELNVRLSHLLICSSSPETSEVTTPVNTQWPDIEEVRKLPFDPYPRDPKFRKASPVYADKMPKCLKGQQTYASTTAALHEFSIVSVLVVM